MSAFLFLIETLFDLYILIVMLRFLLQLTKADFYNDVSQLTVKLTNPLLRPLRHLIPGLWGLDLASILLMWALKIIELLLLGASFSPGLLLFAAVQLISLAIYIFLFVIIIQVILSWISLLGSQPFLSSHPLVRLLYQLSEPVIRPIRRLLPPISGLDLSPMVAMILLIFINKLLYDFLLLAGFSGI